MRQLFLPACLWLLTWSGPAGPDPRISLEQFTDARAATVRTAAPFSPADNAAESVPEMPPVLRASLEVPPAAETPSAIAPIAFSEIALAVESPAPGGDIAIALPDMAPLPKSRPPPRPVIYRSAEEICDTLVKAAQSNDLPAPYFIRLLFQESRFKPGAVSRAGALGIAQFMPETATGMGVENPFDPLQAIPASARLLRELLSQFGNLGLAAAAYNAGPKRIQDWLTSKGKLPEETQGYVKTITGRTAENWKAPESGSPAVKLPRHAPCQDAAGLLAWNGPDAIPVPPASPRRVAALAEAGRKLARKPSGGKDDAKVAAKAGPEAASKTAAAKPTKPGKGAVQLAARERKRKSQSKSKAMPLRLTQR